MWFASERERRTCGQSAGKTDRRKPDLGSKANGALEREYLTENPPQRVHKLREFECERRFEPGEEERLRALTKDDWLWRLRLVAALETGCRNRRDLQRSIQTPMGSQRAAPLESHDERPAH